MHRFELVNPSLLEGTHRSKEDVIEAVQKFLLHLVEIYNLEIQDLRVFRALYSELSHQQVSPPVPLINIYFLFLHSPDNVNYAKMVSVLDSDVFGVTIPWQNEGSLAVNHKENVIDGFVFDENVLILSIELRLEQGAHPQNEG